MTHSEYCSKADDVFEAVYFRHHSLYLYLAESLEDALGFLDAGRDDGGLSSVGVYVNGAPKLTGCEGDEPTPERAQKMRELYHEATRSGPGHRRRDPMTTAEYRSWTEGDT